MQPLAALLKTSAGGNIYQTPNHQRRDCGKPNRRLGAHRGDRGGRDRGRNIHTEVSALTGATLAIKYLLNSQTSGRYSLLTSNLMSPEGIPPNVPVSGLLWPNRFKVAARTETLVRGVLIMRVAEAHLMGGPWCYEVHGILVPTWKAAHTYETHNPLY